MQNIVHGWIFFFPFYCLALICLPDYLGGREVSVLKEKTSRGELEINAVINETQMVLLEREHSMSKTFTPPACSSTSSHRQSRESLNPDSAYLQNVVVNLPPGG